MVISYVVLSSTYCLAYQTHPKKYNFLLVYLATKKGIFVFTTYDKYTCTLNIFSHLTNLCLNAGNIRKCFRVCLDWGFGRRRGEGYFSFL